jgi:hypothetical protein
VSIENDEQIPDEISLWYSAPNNDFTIIVSFVAIENGKGVIKATESFPIEKSISWRNIAFKLTSTFSDIKQIHVELRADQMGEYFFDDVSLIRRETPFSGKPDRILFVDSRQGIPSQDRLPAIMSGEFDKRGWNKRDYVTWENISANILRQSRAVIFIGVPQRPELTEIDRATIKLLQQYVDAGGGVLLTQNTSQMPVNELAIPDALMRAFGSRLLLETVISDPAVTKQIGKWGPDIYTFTDKVKQPVNDGIRGVCYSSYIGWMMQYGVLPFLPESPWQVVLSAGPKSSSVPGKVGLDVMDKEIRPAGFDKDVPPCRNPGVWLRPCSICRTPGKQYICTPNNIQ